MSSDAPEALRSALRDVVAPVLRDAGYRASGSTWRRVTDRDDTAIVNLQLSQWNGKDEAKVYVNLAVVPAPWWEWTRADAETSAKRPLEHHGLFRERMEPPETERARPDSWRCWDESSALTAAEELRHRLSELGLPKLADLSDRERMIGAVRDGAIGDMSSFPDYRLLTLVVLLSEIGGEEFVRACEELGRPLGAPAFEERARRAIEWARQRVPA